MKRSNKKKERKRLQKRGEHGESQGKKEKQSSRKKSIEYTGCQIDYAS